MRNKIRIKSTSLVQFRKLLIQFRDHIHLIEKLFCACWKTQAEHPVPSPTLHASVLLLTQFRPCLFEFQNCTSVSHIFQLEFSFALLVRRVVGCRFCTRYLINLVLTRFDPILHSSLLSRRQITINGATGQQKVWSERIE